MRGLLAISAAPGAAPISDHAIQAAAGRLGDDIDLHRCADGWVAFAGPAPDDRLTPGANRFTVRLTRSTRGAAGDASVDDLAGLLGRGARLDGAALSDLLPPFAAAHRAGPDAPVVLAGDWLGLRQLFWWQGDRIAAVSTSALALSALAGTGLDSVALGVQSLLGWQLGLDTIFAGVTKLAPGAAAVLRDGRVEVRRYAEPVLAAEDPDRPPAQVVDDMAGILRDLLHRYLTDHPDTVLQLSGGQDSRMLLCAIPPKLRAGLRALTLDVHGGVESRIATRLSAACGLAHQLHWLDERPPSDPATAHRAALDAAAALDAMASPLALGPLTLIEADLEQGRRLSGTGGGTAKGIYYPGQPRHRLTSPALVERLANWRLFANEAVEREALDPDFAAATQAGALPAVAACFDQYSASWLRATDEFYLWQRMQRWAGAHDTPAAVTRQLVNPLLDRRFIHLMLGLPPDHKRGSRLTGLLMDRLDPGLARIPLDSGLVPAQLARPSLRSQAAVTRVVAHKTAGKVWQRLRGGRPAQLGAAGLSRLVLATWRAAPELVDPVRTTGLIRDGWLDQLLDGRRAASPATVTFLVNLLVAAGTGRSREGAALVGSSGSPRG
jgi:asparagine synthase (glutamine-hydrolysing)